MREQDFFRISNRLKLAIRRSGRSQTELAFGCGLLAQKISEALRGLPFSTAKAHKLINLAESLGAPAHAALVRARGKGRTR